VAQLRRDAPKRAAGMYAEALTREFENDEEEEVEADSKAEGEALIAADRSIVLVSNEDQSSLDNEPSRKKRKRSGRKPQESSVAAGGEGNANTDERPGWKLDVPFGSKNELERWQNGEMAEVYSQTLRTLLHLQGEVQAQSGRGDSEESSVTALATTIGKAERAGRAAEVVENMLI
jgi:kinetochor protein Mis14/NSL1